MQMQMQVRAQANTCVNYHNTNANASANAKNEKFSHMWTGATQMQTQDEKHLYHASMV